MDFEVQIQEIFKYGEQVFSITDEEKLYELYVKKIKEVAKELCDEKFSYKEKCLNILEYIRLKGMYENHPDKETTELSQTGINIGLLNKGVCGSQSCFMADLLTYSGIEAEKYKSDYFDEENDVYGKHGVVIAKAPEDKTFVWIDPTWYNRI